MQCAGFLLSFVIWEINPELEASCKSAVHLRLLLVKNAASRDGHVQCTRSNPIVGSERILIDEALIALGKDVCSDHEARMWMGRKRGPAHVVKRNRDEGVKVWAAGRNVHIASGELLAEALGG
jgi:hypothetical protein